MRLFTIGVLLLSALQCHPDPEYFQLTGVALGTTYAITFESPAKAHSSFPQSVSDILQNTFAQIDRSVSIYNNHSLISLINDNKSFETDSLFRVIYYKAQEINTQTDDALDISAGPLISAWGFGSTNRKKPTQAELDSLMTVVGAGNITLVNNRIVKKKPSVSLNMNSIAKGFTVDLVAQRLDSLAINNYLVEIGGEIVCKGVNSHKRAWLIGIDKPVDGNLTPGKNIQLRLRLSDKALATSGNYRNYYIQDGQKRAHIIDPTTGYPVLHSLLSSSVIAHDCITADGYATAFMVMGLDKSITFLKNHPELGAVLIYEQDGSLHTYTSENIASFISTE